MTFPLNFAHAFGVPESTARFRETQEDFQVTEDLGFEPSGQGEHIYLHICKRGENTQWVAGQLARFAGVKPRDVSFSGLKDRHAITTQWFSIYFPKGTEPRWEEFAQTAQANVELLRVTRHNRKLRRGEHAGNRFTIRLTQMTGTHGLSERLGQVAERGVPNYFGEQRFGRNGNNLHLASDWLEHQKPVKPRSLQGMVTSAARSWLFNRVLSERVTAGNWDKVIPGEVLDESQSPTGPLWGRGRSPAQADAAAVEQSVIAAWQLWAHGLEHCGLSQERRALILRPADFDWQFADDNLTLHFSLAPGQFATAILREIAQLQVVRPEESE